MLQKIEKINQLKFDKYKITLECGHSFVFDIGINPIAKYKSIYKLPCKICFKNKVKTDKL